MNGGVLVGLDVSGIAGWRSRLVRVPGLPGVAFTAAERRWAAGRPERFARLWTVKEAVVKALGTGFGELGWQDVAVDLSGASARVDLPGEASGRWRVAEFPARGHAVAVALAGPPAAVAVRVVRVPGWDGLARGPCRAAEVARHARRAARLAAAVVAPGVEPVWGRTPQGAPLLVDGPAVSLSHADGLAGAAVAVAR